MYINLKEMKRKGQCAPYKFEEYCKTLENHKKATTINFRGEYYNNNWFVKFEDLNLIISADDLRPYGERCVVYFSPINGEYDS